MYKECNFIAKDVGYGGSLGLLQVSVTMCGPRRPDHEGRRRYRLTRRNRSYYYHRSLYLAADFYAFIRNLQIQNYARCA
jgi:hypothetical protein